MFRAYSEAKVRRMLQTQGSPVTIRLDMSDGAWIPTDRFGAKDIGGPVDRLTYTLLDDGRLQVDVDTGEHAFAIGPAQQRFTTAEPIPPLEVPSRRHAHHGLLLAVYSMVLLLMGLGGFTWAYASSGSRVSAGVVGGFGALVLSYIVQVIVTVAFGASGRLHRTGADATPGHDRRPTQG